MNEYRTVEYMIRLYCHAHHSAAGELCQECSNLLDYAEQRLKSCPLQPDKPVCANCPIHCYKPEMREKIRRVMKYSGPRMMFHHPILATQYLWRKFSKKPGNPVSQS